MLYAFLEDKIMHITKRRVNVKRHTTGYLCGGKWRSRGEVVKMAERGKVHDVVVCKHPASKYIRAQHDAPKLSELPMKIEA